MSQSLSLRAQCRKRAWEYLNPCVAAAAFMSLEQLQHLLVAHTTRAMIRLRASRNVCPSSNIRCIDMGIFSRE